MACAPTPAQSRRRRSTPPPPPRQIRGAPQQARGKDLGARARAAARARAGAAGDAGRAGRDA
eukprot:scaffold13667_cov68-Phaeocystis_antarctica.AAC.4